MKVLAKVVITSTLLLGLLVSATPVSAYNINSNVIWERALAWGNSNYPPTYQFHTPTGDVNKQGMAVYAPINGVGQYSLYYIKSGYRSNLVKDKIYSVNISFDFAIAQTAQISPVDYAMYSGNSYFRLLGVNKIAGREFCGQWQETELQRSPTSSESASGVVYKFTGSGTCTQSSDSYEIILQALESAENVQVQIGNYNGDPVFNWTLSAQPFVSLEPQYGTISISPMNEWTVDSTKSINEEQQQAGEQAQQDGQTAANQGQQSTDQQGASLIQGASNIIGALTDTAPGSCNINLNMGVLDMGQQNFCQGDIGPIRPIIATVTNILFAFVSLKVFVFLIGVMFGLFDQFFGTKTEMGGGV